MTNCRAAFSFAGGAPWPAAAMATDSVGQCIGRSRCLRGLRGRAAGEEGLHHENAMRPANVSFVPFRSLPDATPARLAVHRLNRCAPEAAEPFVLETWRKLFAEGGEIGSIDVLTRGLDPCLHSEIQTAQGDTQAAEDLEIANRDAVASDCFFWGLLRVCGLAVAWPLWSPGSRRVAR